MRLLLVLLCLPLQAHALPIVYDIAFDATPTDYSDGIGSFIWHDDTQTISSFNWDFGDGRVGGMLDTRWTGDLSVAFYEVMTEQDVDPSFDCRVDWSIPCRLGLSFFGPDYLSGWPTDAGGYFAEIYGGDIDAFNFFDGMSGRDVFGHFTVTLVESVPEPATLLLLSSALAGLELTRRKRAAAHRAA